MKPSTIERLRELLSEPGAESGGGYLDFLGQAVQAGPTTGLGQRLMRTSAVPLVYEKYWRPALGRIAKGLRGPSMAEEQAFAHRELDVGAGDVVLDVACGTGAFTRSFAAAVDQDGLAIGLDGSATMLRRAVGGTQADMPVGYVRADAVRPPLRDSTVDGVCCFAALHLFAEPEAALQSYARILRPGGRIALLTSARHRGPVSAAETALGEAAGIRMFPRGYIEETLCRFGFGEITVRYNALTQLVSARLTSA